MKKIGVNLEKLSLKHKIAEEIRKAIFEGRLQPGEKLTEYQLSKELGVSRAPIREAIQILELEGVLISTPFKDTKVASISKEEVIELLIPIRLQIESFALRKAFTSWGEDHFLEFQNIIDEMKKGAMFQDLYTLVDSDIRFHELIVKYADLEGASKLWGSIVNRIRLHFMYQGTKYNDLQQIVSEHEELLLAFKSGNEQLASQALKEHILDKNIGDLSIL